MLKKLLLVPVIGVLATLSVAAATSLDVVSGNEQAGALEGVEISCDPDGVDLVFGNEVDTLLASSVNVKGIDSDCDGSVMFLRVFDAADGALSQKFTVDPITSPQTGGLVFTTPIPIADIDHVNIIIEK